MAPSSHILIALIFCAFIACRNDPPHPVVPVEEGPMVTPSKNGPGTAPNKTHSTTPTVEERPGLRSRGARLLLCASGRNPNAPVDGV